MKFTEFKNGLNNGEEFSVYLFEGEDAYFRSRGVELVKNAFLSEPSLNCVELGGDAQANEILSSVEQFPLLSKKRITIVREFYPDKKVLEALCTSLEVPHLDSILIIVNEKKFEALKKLNALTVDCGKADTSLLVKWITAECRREGVTVEQNSALLLVDFCQNDMCQIENETRKLIFLVGKGGNIDEKTVKENVSRDAEYKIYEMTDFIGKRQFDLALDSVNELLSRGETPQRLLISLYGYFRRLLFVSISDKSNIELSSMLGIKVYPVEIAKKQAKLFKKRALKKAVDLIVDADNNIKNGFIDQSEAFWLTLFKIMTEEK